MTNQQRQPRGDDSLRFPLSVAAIYAVTAGLWILLSDRAAAGLFPPTEVVARIQTFKGLGFVAVTTIVLFVLLYHQSRQRAEIEKGLRESEEKFAAAFRASPIGIGITTIDGTIVEANQALCDLMGYTREELLGKTSISLGIFTPETRQEFTDSVRRGGGRVTNVERAFSDRHGNPHTCLYSTETISFRGEPHLLTTCLDITERKRTEEVLRLNNFVLERTSDAVYWINVATILDVNDAACRMLGYTREEFQGMSVTVIDPTLSEAEIVGVWDRLKREGALLLETQHKTKDGRILSVEITMNYIEFEGKELNCCFVRDVTERKRAEEALRQNEANLAALIENTDGLIWSVDADYHLITGNSVFHQDITDALGHDILIGESVLPSNVPPAVQDEWRDNYDRALRGERFTVETRLHFVPSARWAEHRFSPIRDGDGNITGVTVFGRDVTERKQAEEALRQSESRFRSLFDNTLDTLLVADDEGCYVDVNLAACELLGYTREELLQMRMADITPPAYRLQVEQLWQDLITAGEMRGEHTVVCKDGTTRETEFRAVAHVQPGLHLSAMRDITERKQAEEALRDSEIRYRRLFEAAKDGILILDAETGQIVDVNPFLVSLLDYSREEFQGKRIWEIGSFMNIAASKTAFAKLRKYGYVRYEDLPLETKDGKQIAVEFISNTYEVDHKSVIQCNIRDITDRKQAEQALRESEERFQQLANSMDEVFFLLDVVSGDFLYISPAYEKIWGRSLEHIHTYDDFLPGVHPDDRRLLHQPGQPDSFRPMVEYRIIRPDGETRWLRARTYPIRDAQGQIIRLAGIAQDITVEHEQRTLAEALADTAAVVNSTLDLGQVLGQILDNVGQVVPHDAAEVWLVEDGIARVVGRRGHAGRSSEEALLAIRLPVNEIANLRTAEETGQPVLIADTRDYEGWVEGTPAWVRSLVTVPIQVNDDVLGFLNLLSDTPNHYSPAQAGHLQAFANQVATAIQNARLYQELERHSESLRQAVEERTAELLQTKERVETILNYSPDPILLLKPSGTIDTANPAFQRVFGYQVDELHRQQPFSLIAPDHAEAMQIALARAIGSRRVERRELVARRKDDTTFDAEMAFAPIVEEGGALLGVVCSVRDISPLKEVARMKDAFVSNVSHELRTPITGLKLNHKLIELDPGKSDIYLERQGREIDRLNVLIEDLLRLSRLDQERVRLDIKPVDLNTLVAQYFNDRVPLAESKDLTLSFEEHSDLPAVQADAGLIGQTLSVLLTNAFNYTPAGGQVMVTTQSAEFDGKRWAGFSVGDTGPGISPADFPHLFERFYRGRAGYESGVPGTGLGLAIAREIVERHGGRIEVANQADANAGAVFTVWLPVAEK